MEEKIKRIRKKLIEELEKLEDGIVVKLDYGLQFLDAILFDYFDDRKFKKFALPIHVLSKIDFSNVSFDKFVVRDNYSTFSFNGLHGVNINPQTIYNRDLRNTSFNGVNFIGPFTGTKIQGADFTGSTGAVINPMELYKTEKSDLGYNGYVIDISNCKFSGVTFIGSIKNITKKSSIYYIPTYIKIIGADFTGSNGAVIKLKPAKYGLRWDNEYCQYYSNLTNCTLTDATIKGSYEKVTLCNTDFSGARGNLTINPQDINEKELKRCNFKGVIFDGSFDGCDISNSDFTGSLNAYINVSELDERQFKGTNFTDTRVIGLEEKGFTLSEDGFIEDGVIETVNKFLGIEHETEIIKKQELELARKKLIELNKRKIRERIKELANLIQTQEKLGIPESKIYGSIPVTEEIFLKSVDDHFEIDEEYIDIKLLRFLNLSLIDFTNVKVAGIDFRYTSARINPQTVYKKNISHCTFDSENVKFFDNYTGVIMRGTNFNECDFDAPKIR